MDSATFYDVIIIGAGAAGMMCAIETGNRGRHVAVIERQKEIWEKIRISGGGRCNFTNVNTAPENFISNNPHFCVSALSRFPPQAFISLVEKHGIAYHEKKIGQLFCNKSAQEIIDLLLKKSSDACVMIKTNTSVLSILPSEIKGGQSHAAQIVRYTIQTQQETLHCSSLVIATGGLSIPKIGAAAFGYDVAKQFGLNVIEPKLVLVPFIWNRTDAQRYSDLAGVSLNVIAACNGKSFREDMLFTHRGISGPAILQISSYWNEADTMLIDVLPEIDFFDVIQKYRSSKMLISTFLSRYLPQRFVDKYLRWIHDDLPLYKLSNDDLRSIDHALHNWIIIPAGTEGFTKAEVTRGGVDTNELSSKTMEALKSPGLYFIGEVVDVTGWLGGYNLQWAWSSGWAAGQVV